jgi:hypothetical protein
MVKAELDDRAGTACDLRRTYGRSVPAPPAFHECGDARSFVLRRDFILGSIASIVLGGVRLGQAAESGVLEGHLTIVSPKGVDSAEAGPSKDSRGDYAAYPLLILSKDGKKEIRLLTADTDGNYRVSLPPGEYVLDAKGRAPKRIRATPKPFTIVSSQTVRVDFDLDTGIR